MRTIEISGHLVADAERRISKNGKEYLYFRLGNNEFNDKDEQGNKRTYWFSVTSYNQRHFSMAQYLTKGKPIIVRGEYSDRVAINQTNGFDIWRDVLADAIYFSPFSDNTNKPSTQEVQPQTQTVLKPTTAELTIPTNTTAENDNSDDDLPF